MVRWEDSVHKVNGEYTVLGVKIVGPGPEESAPAALGTGPTVPARSFLQKGAPDHEAHEQEQRVVEVRPGTCGTAGCRRSLCGAMGARRSSTIAATKRPRLSPRLSRSWEYEHKFPLEHEPFKKKSCTLPSDMIKVARVRSTCLLAVLTLIDGYS